MPHATSTQAQEALAALLAARLEPPAAAWLAARDPEASLESLLPLLPEVERAVGRRPLIAAFAARAAAVVPGVWGEIPVGEWTLGAAVRALLVARAAQREADPCAALFGAYDQGDTQTRVACLRALDLCGPGSVEAGLRLIHDAGRTYLTELMSAAWCGNAFSAEHLSDHDHRKAVLKALFCDVPVAGFLALERRADPELAKSLCDYADERLAAGRPVPRAVWPLAALHPRPGLVARLVGMLEHPDREERLVAARALQNARDPRAGSFLRERREREQDDEVRRALDSALKVGALEEAA
ncbi:MAG: EboA domain-containing protein [Planctomycetota bacterium]